MTFLPSFIKENDYFNLDHAENTCHSVKKKCNVMIQKMYIICNYKKWRVHYLILNSIKQCVKLGIG